MVWKIVLSVLLLVATSCARTELHIDNILAQQRNMMRLMMSTYKVNAVPADAVPAAVDIDACFNYYVQEQEKFVDIYNTEYKRCNNAADEAKREISQQNDEKRQSVLDRTHSVCSSLEECEGLTDGLEFFECSYTAADEGYPVIYSVSVDAKERTSELNIRYQQIDYEEDLCVTKAYNTYMSDLDSSTKDLQKCLKGDIVPPTDSTTLSPEEPEENTTEPAPEEDLGFRQLALHRLMKPF